MSDQGKANYDAYRKLAGRPGVSAAPLPEYGQLPMELAYAFDAGADAVEAWVADAPVDEDAPGSKPAKVIVVAEASGREQRYEADGFDGDSSGLDITRDGRVIATYPGQHSWLSAREEGATVPDATRRALKIAERALEEIRSAGSEVDVHELADAALGEIFTETEL